MPIPLGSRMNTSLVSHFVLHPPLARRKHDRKTSFASQDRTDSENIMPSSKDPKADGQETRISADECHATSRRLPCGRRTNDDVPGCRLPQAVAATHVRTRTISHARTPGTIPSSRCQTTRTRSILRPARISVLMDEIFSADWWSQSGSNRRPHACKARALPAELWPLNLTGSRALAASERRLVGLGRFELPTSRLSSARSNQLSYKPGSDDRPKPRKRASQRLAHREIGTGSSMKKEKRRRRCPANGRHRFETMHPDVSKRSDRSA
jgi:hypothetical protein